MKTLCAITLMLLSSTALAQTQSTPTAPAPSSTAPSTASTPSVPAQGRSITASIQVSGTMVAPAKYTPSMTTTEKQEDGTVQQVISY